MTTLYKREQALKAQGLTVRRANHFEHTINEYGEKLAWVIDRGAFQALRAYRTKVEAMEAAESMVVDGS